MLELSQASQILIDKMMHGWQWLIPAFMGLHPFQPSGCGCKRLFRSRGDLLQLASLRKLARQVHTKQVRPSNLLVPGFWSRQPSPQNSPLRMFNHSTAMGHWQLFLRFLGATSDDLARRCQLRRLWPRSKTATLCTTPMQAKWNANLVCCNPFLAPRRVLQRRLHTQTSPFSRLASRQTKNEKNKTHRFCFGSMEPGVVGRGTRVR